MESPRPGKKWIVPFVATLFGMMALQISSLGFAPLLPQIQKAFGMSYSQIGLFTGTYGLLAIVLSVPAGVAAKYFGEKRVLIAGLVVVALGLGALSVAGSFTGAILGRGLWIAGYRFAFVCVLTAIGLTCPPSLRGRTMGVLGAMSSLASVVGAPFGSSIGEAFGWREGIRAFGCAALLGAAVVAIFYRDPSAGPEGGQPHSIGETRSSAADAPKRVPDTGGMGGGVAFRPGRDAVVQRDFFPSLRGSIHIQAGCIVRVVDHQQRLSGRNISEPHYWISYGPLQQMDRNGNADDAAGSFLPGDDNERSAAIPNWRSVNSGHRLHRDKPDIRHFRRRASRPTNRQRDGNCKFGRRGLRISRPADVGSVARLDGWICCGLVHDGGNCGHQRCRVRDYRQAQPQSDAVSKTNAGRTSLLRQSQLQLCLGIHCRQ